VSRITRKELKTDEVAIKVELGVSYFEHHKQKILLYGGIVLAAALIVVGYTAYSRSQQGVREQALYHAIQVQEAPVTQQATGGLQFPTQEAKDAEATKAFTDLRNKWSGSAEGQIASYYLASIQADQGNIAQAEKGFQSVADNASAPYASLAKLALAQIYFSDGRNQPGENLLRDLMSHPTVFVSSDTAAVTLARHYIGLKNNAEAKKLLDPLKTKPGVSTIAVSMLGEMQN
jgi:predicted negative regulator of RcsB-dependent stress response